MKLNRIASLLVTVSLLATAAFAQNPATQGSASGRYGMSAWAINNQRVASLFNYDIDSAFGSGLANFTFPQMTCQQALAFGGAKNVNPFSTNATVKIVDLTTANTETVALSSAPSFANGYCTLSLAASNAHFSYHLRSGTCGLKEAQNDKGANAPGSPFPTGEGPISAALDWSDDYLYVANAYSANVSQFEIDTNSGRLHLISAPRATGVSPVNIVAER
jgi:hypothetical protein